ncbi:hypothetical protein [Desulfoscipio gibsoniae]
MSKTLRINTRSGEFKYEDIPEKYALLGDRGLTSMIIFDEVPTTCNTQELGQKVCFLKTTK